MYVDDILQTMCIGNTTIAEYKWKKLKFWWLFCTKEDYIERIFNTASTLTNYKSIHFKYLLNKWTKISLFVVILFIFMNLFTFLWWKTVKRRSLTQITWHPSIKDFFSVRWIFLWYKLLVHSVENSSTTRFWRTRGYSEGLRWQDN